MVKITKFLFFIFISISIAACSGGNSKQNSIGYLSRGSYNFSMYDSTGFKIAEGTLTVKSFSDNKLSGVYSFTKVYHEFEGYQSMSNGEFTGSVNEKGKMVLINTNPLQADNNVFFNLKIEPSRLKGDWYYTVSRRVSTPCRVEVFKNQ
jgi:hypothetical protein